ncbi:TonB-dependent receptor domain-containing protein [Sphingomonas kyeonggiensis]|uniref:Outer membrane receptor protein involved in Fe transport n=1 Tax=Sphingomonas kyeonggiensis TaxID=1268553 RepID=A0A7W6JT24_9SPHN|nr:outer membrane receptor protein involved in Fe transport [Sphingomonas kyeonggiensis]
MKGISSAFYCSAAIAAIVASSPVAAQTRSFDLSAGVAEQSIPAFAKQAGIQIMADGRLVRGKRTNAVRGTKSVEEGLRELLAGTNLLAELQPGRAGSFIIRAGGAASAAPKAQPVAPAPQTAPVEEPASGQQATFSNDIIVTAQKRRESMQSVPIAMSAFTSKTLDEMKIEGGAELVRAVPNISFSKSNFASYNFSIRGVGTKALSVASDPGVAVSFNNTPLIRNRLFEQEYFDVQRVEVLRGPQGTLYGRNATAGVVNMIPNFANPDKLAAEFKLETGNYKSMRAAGMVNLPLTDTLAVRAAGAWTNRDGYDYNTVTDQRVNGRNLWGSRVTAAWQPGRNFKINAAWEHFYEDDDRSRTGKQLCHTDPGPASMGGKTLTPVIRGALSQGCSPGSLYDDGAYGVPNGFSLPYINAAASVIALGYKAGAVGGAAPVMLIDDTRDPYASVTQSRNLREIATAIDPRFRAKNDILQLNIEAGLGKNLKFYSNTSYSEDSYYSFQDYNRFNSGSVFNDSSVLFALRTRPLATKGIAVGGILDDPQLGASSNILGADTVNSHSKQWYQEFRLQSSFDGRIEFNLGVNYLNFKIKEDYYVFNNLFTAIARTVLGTGNTSGVVRDCTGWTGGADCTYVDPNPLNSLNGNGHNYFRSQNIAKTESYAGFGEIYFKAADRLKVTAGLRYTDDKKTATPIPTQLLLGTGILGFGLINEGYQVSPDIVQKWGRVTGRLVVDWKPRLAFTDETLLYASFAHGYKGGGTNPPGIGANPAYLQFFPASQTFKPESVNAFEVGTKNALAGGRLTLNATAFYYKYKDYQVSQIVDRIALNENYNADIWGAELEMLWRPTRRISLNANVGYLGTRIANGMKSVDVMDRTQGNPDWVIVKPWIQLASNCIAPRALVEKIIKRSSFNNASGPGDLSTFCGGQVGKNFTAGSYFSNLTGIVYDPATDAPNNGRGFYADLGGNELPNSPHWTVNLGAQYVLPISEWNLAFRGDYYRQSSSWSRVYNISIDRLRSWDNANISVTLDRPESGFSMQFYIKNLFNKTPITDAFINSDDSGLTANVFTLDPRIIGFNMTKKF